MYTTDHVEGSDKTESVAANTERAVTQRMGIWNETKRYDDDDGVDQNRVRLCVVCECICAAAAGAICGKRVRSRSPCRFTYVRCACIGIGARSIAMFEMSKHTGIIHLDWHIQVCECPSIGLSKNASLYYSQ